MGGQITKYRGDDIETIGDLASTLMTTFGLSPSSVSYTSQANRRNPFALPRGGWLPSWKNERALEVGCILTALSGWMFGDKVGCMRVEMRYVLNWMILVNKFKLI